MDDVNEPKSFCSTRSSIGVPARYHKYKGWSDSPAKLFENKRWVSLESARKFAYGIQGAYLPDERDREAIAQELTELRDSRKATVVRENLRFPRDEDLVCVEDPHWERAIELVANLVYLPPDATKDKQEEWNNVVRSCISNLQYFWDRDTFERCHSLTWEKTVDAVDSADVNPTSRPQTQDEEEETN